MLSFELEEIDMEVVCDDTRQQFNTVEIASILFCLHMKFIEKRDLNFVNTSRYIAKASVSLVVDWLCKLLDLDIYLVGSVAEGVNGSISDLDFMCSFRNGYCCDAYFFRTETTEKKVFLLDCLNASPGYALLWDIIAHIKENIRSWKPLKLDRTIKENTLLLFHNIADGKLKAVERFGTMVLNNSEITEGLLQPNTIRNGPALTTDISFGEVFKNLFTLFRFEVDENISNVYKLVDKLLGTRSADRVLALPFHCKTFLRKFINRKRQYNWPSRSMLIEIINIPAYVVPVGCKGSRFEDKEWRISYTLTETYLIKSLNEVQLLLLYQLKLVAKEQLVTVCPAISSYVIKNLVLWIVECSPANYFQYKNFIPLYKSSLLILWKQIWKGCMPNYMIPKRNLFEGKLSIVNSFKLYFRLMSLIKEGLNVSPYSQMYMTVAREGIDILRKKILQERQTMIMRLSKYNAYDKVVLSMIGFVSPKELMQYLFKTCSMELADIPLD